MGRYALLPLIVALASCLPQQQQHGSFAQPTARTSVERGVRYETGKPTYDELFSQVHRLHAEVSSVEDDRRAARQGLATELGLLPSSASADVVRVLADRAATLKKKGVTFTVAGTTARASGDGASLAQALSTTLASEKAIHDSLKKVPERVTSVIGMIPSLEGSVDRDIDASKRAEVKDELAAARRLMEKLRDRAKELAEQGERFSTDLVKAATGGAAQPAPSASGKPAAPPAKPQGGTPPPSGKVGTPPPPATAAPTGTAPPPPPPKPDDFNP